MLLCVDEEGDAGNNTARYDSTTHPLLPTLLHLPTHLSSLQPSQSIRPSIYLIPMLLVFTLLSPCSPCDCNSLEKRIYKGHHSCTSVAYLMLVSPQWQHNSYLGVWCHCGVTAITSYNQNNPYLLSESIQWMNIMVCITHAILHHWNEFGELIFILIRSKQKENLIQNV